MEINTTTHTLRRLTASEGHVLVDAAALRAAQAADATAAPYCARTVYLGSGDTPGRYTEITDTEAAALAARFAPVAPVNEAEKEKEGEA